MKTWIGEGGKGLCHCHTPRYTFILHVLIQLPSKVLTQPPICVSISCTFCSHCRPTLYIHLRIPYLNIEISVATALTLPPIQSTYQTPSLSFYLLIPFTPFFSLSIHLQNNHPLARPSMPLVTRSRTQRQALDIHQSHAAPQSPL